MSRLDQVNKDIQLLEEERERLLKEFETYKIGDIFDNTWGDKDCVVMLCSVGENKTTLMSIGSYYPGYRWGAAFIIEPKDIYAITKSELEGMAPNFTKDFVKRD